MVSDPYVRAWALAFVKTIAIEAPVVVLLTRSTLPLARRVAWAIVGQTLTHPAVWFVFPELGLGRPHALLASELWAWLAEAFLYWLAGVCPGVARALGVSALANGASLGVGLALRSWLHA